jgi:hypothetical protein
MLARNDKEPKMPELDQLKFPDTTEIDTLPKAQEWLDSMGM